MPADRKHRAAIGAIHARTAAAHQARVEMVGRATGMVKEFAKNTSGRGQEIPHHLLVGRDVDAAHDLATSLVQAHHEHGHMGLEHAVNFARFLGCMATLAALTWIWSAVA